MKEEIATNVKYSFTTDDLIQWCAEYELKYHDHGEVALRMLYFIFNKIDPSLGDEEIRKKFFQEIKKRELINLN